MSTAPELPRSVTNLTINTTAMLISLAALAGLVAYGERISGFATVMLLWASYVLPLVLMEALWLRPIGAVRGVTPVTGDIGRVGVKLLGMMLTPDSPLKTHRARIRWALGYGLALAVAAHLLHALHGIDRMFIIGPRGEHSGEEADRAQERFATQVIPAFRDSDNPERAGTT